MRHAATSLLVLLCGLAAAALAADADASGAAGTPLLLHNAAERAARRSARQDALNSPSMLLPGVFSGSPLEAQTTAVQQVNGGSSAIRPFRRLNDDAAITPPPKATPPPQFADLYVKSKRRQVAALLQRLVTDPGATRLLFEDFKLKFNKRYASPAADKAAFTAFTANIRLLAASNARNPYFEALNQYSDRSWADLKAKVLGNKRLLSRLTPPKPGVRTSASTKAAVQPPKAVDWRARGKVTPPGNQLDCAASWAWAGVAALESRILIQSGKTALNFRINLAEQHMVDCIRGGACSGGTPDEVFSFASRTGILQERSYPYTGNQQTCQNRTMPTSGVSKLPAVGFKTVPRKSATQLMLAVAQGPVTVAFAASEQFVRYSDTLVYNGTCNGGGVNHVLTLVGYRQGSGPGKTDAFWMAKNSWGTSWGDGGFVKIPMLADGTNGFCGMYWLGGWYPLNLTTFPRTPAVPAKPRTPAAPPLGCADFATQCATWAKQGHCNSNPDFMIGTPAAPGNCRKSCGICGVASTPSTTKTNCKDTNPGCRYWASLGMCQSDPTWMVGNATTVGACQDSCGLCDGEGQNQAACIDWSDSCAWWAANGECTASPEYMSIYCQFSCQSCNKTVLDTAPGRCFDKDVKNCAYWARSGYCPNSRYAVAQTCPESCGLCQQGCVDSNQYCEFWAAMGECSNNQDYMWVHCPISCTICAEQPVDTSPPTGCVDKEDNCGAFAGVGFCNDTSWKDWMAGNCPLSCKLCGGLECSDSSDSCESHAENGLCTNPGFEEWMRSICPITCKFPCEDPGDPNDPNACVDRVAGCTTWKEQDRCKDPLWERNMNETCAASCGLCTPALPPPE